MRTNLAKKLANGRYKLIGQTPVVCPDLMEWAEFMETGERQVLESFIDKYRVSTVFLGLDHRSPMNDGPPILFETMIFLNSPESLRRPGEAFDEWLMRRRVLSDAEPLPVEAASRCSTWLEAEQDHERACLMVEAATGSPRRGVSPIQMIQMNEAGKASQAMQEIVRAIRGERRIRRPGK